MRTEGPSPSLGVDKVPDEGRHGHTTVLDLGVAEKADGGLIEQRAKRVGERCGSGVRVVVLDPSS